MTATTLNGTNKISNDAGDYIVLADYGTEGLSVGLQTENLQEAINYSHSGNTGSPTVLVKLVWLNVTEAIDADD